MPYSMCVCAQSLQLCLTLCDPMTVAHQNPLFMEFSRQEYWSGLPCPPPGDLPNPGFEPASLMSPALAGGFFIGCSLKDLKDPLKGSEVLTTGILALCVELPQLSSRWQ